MENTWFTKPSADRHEIYLPGTDAAVAARRRELEAQPRQEGDEEGHDRWIREELEQLRVSMTGYVELRPLNAGDVAMLNEVRVRQGGAMVAIGEAKLLCVELALVGWSLGQPITRDTIKQLNPMVFEQIYDLVDVGEGATVGAANGTGAPTTPAATPAAQPEVAAAPS